jgi:hypothetical protein
MLFNHLAKDELLWLPERGVGYYPVKHSPYDEDYFNIYVENAQTEIGLALNKARIDLVNKYLDGKAVLDVGIGCGAFVEARPYTWGFDINPKGVAWLKENNKYLLPYTPIEGMTFWDSLEHIHDPSDMLDNAKAYVFISCPIYTDAEHIKRSKHFRKNEHCWYWTESGLKHFMSMYKFHCVEMNRMESDIGREDIGTFVFKRAA